MAHPTALPPTVGETSARRAEQVGTPTAGGSSSAHQKPTVTSTGVAGPDPADVLTRAASTHRAAQVVAAQNTTAAASLSSVPQAALAGLLPMPG